MKLLEQFNKNNKTFGITDAHKVPNDALVSYIGTQIAEMQSVLVRLRIDVLLNQSIKVEGKQEREGRDDKIKKLTNDIEQMVEAIDVLTELKAELSI